jgi:hypothetical protein
MPQSANTTGMLPLTWTVAPFRSALTSNVTGFVCPRSVRSPVAFAVTVTPSAGTDPRSIGDVSVNVAVGNSPTDMMRFLNWPSLRDWSLLTDAICTTRPRRTSTTW